MPGHSLAGKGGLKHSGKGKGKGKDKDKGKAKGKRSSGDEFENVLLEIAIAFGQGMTCEGCVLDRDAIPIIRDLFDQTVAKALVTHPGVWEMGPQRTYVLGQVKKIAAEACAVAKQQDLPITEDILEQAAAERIAQQRVVCDKAVELQKNDPRFGVMAQGGIFCPS